MKGIPCYITQLYISSACHKELKPVPPCQENNCQSFTSTLSEEYYNIKLGSFRLGVKMAVPGKYPSKFDLTVVFFVYFYLELYLLISVMKYH